MSREQFTQVKEKVLTTIIGIITRDVTDENECTFDNAVSSFGKFIYFLLNKNENAAEKESTTIAENKSVQPSQNPSAQTTAPVVEEKADTEKAAAEVEKPTTKTRFMTCPPKICGTRNVPHFYGSKP